MRLHLLLVFLTMAVLVYGMPPISREFNTHCRCPQVESRIIPPGSLKSLRIISPDANCQNTEVIAGLADGEKICLNPKSAWVRKLVRFVRQRQEAVEGRMGSRLKAK